MTLRIGIDIDDVMAQFVPHFLVYYNHHTNDVITPEDIKAWNFENYLPACNHKHSVFKNIYNEFVEDGWFIHAPEVDNAVSGAKQLMQRGHKVHFISTRSSKALHDTYQWFIDKKLPLGNIYFEREKGWLAQHLGLDIHLDDGVHNLDAMREIGVTPILFDRPWNRSNTDYRRITTWNEFLDIVDEEQIGRLESIARSL